MPSRRAWRLLVVLIASEAGAALLLLVRTMPHGALSTARLISIVVLAAFLIAGLAFASRTPAWAKAPTAGTTEALAGILTVALAAALFLLRYLEPERLLPYYQRVHLLLGFLLLVAAQTFLILAVARRWTDLRTSPALRQLALPAGIAIAVLLGLLVTISVTRIGLTPDSAYWGETGVPLFGWQLAIAVLVGLAAAVTWRRSQQPRALNLLVAIALWALASGIWLNVPNDVLRNSFYAPIRPPSLQPFPNSDAGYYDSMAQSLFIGYPYQGEIPSRPLYIALLAAMHYFFGERYDLIIVGQTLILALIPVFLYALGASLGSRAAGVMAALMAIAREWTTLLISSATRVSNTKMLLVDLPTFLLVLAVCLLTVRWLRRGAGREALFAGAAAGLLLLLRTQAAVIIPAVIVLAVLALGPRRRGAYLQVGIFVAAIALTILPWLVRNYVTHGELTLEAAFQYRIIASQYQYAGNLDIGNIDLGGKSLAGILLEFALADPGFVLGFVANHALATQVGGVLSLPLIHDYHGLLADVNLYWLDLNGSLGPTNMMLIAVYLSMIGLGVAAAWVRLRWAGLVPLGCSLAYSLGNGLARFSGWRYDLPADWIAYFYLSMGIAALMMPFADPRRILDARRLRGESVTGRSTGSTWSALAILSVFVLLGASPLIAELLAGPPRYAGADAKELTRRLAAPAAQSDIEIMPEAVTAFRDSPGTVLETGRVLYPRFFTRGNGLASAHPWPAYAPREFPRLGFLLLNAARHDVILATREVPRDFEHGVDAVVLGCIVEDYIDARLVLIEDRGVVYQGTPLDQPCP